jgi:hypothetical protein
MLVPTRHHELLGSLTEQLRAHHNRATIIGIDGRRGVGKSSLAHWLAWHLGIAVVHLDMFRAAGADGLLSDWRADHLLAAVKSRYDDDRHTIIEGARLLEAMSAIGMRVDRLIFVQGDPADDRSPLVARYLERFDPESVATDLVPSAAELRNATA